MSGALHGDPDPGDAEKGTGEPTDARVWSRSPCARRRPVRRKEVLHRWKEAVNPSRARSEGEGRPVRGAGAAGQALASGAEVTAELLVAKWPCSRGVWAAGGGGTLVVPRQR
ncbi:hypothetical protein GCM10010293_45350 [Streptomyces griseoflavus]|nr:hypothetical protein GCM10010293_45350 [Streptomyces griseoflavus]